MNDKLRKFPANFFWGASTSAHQVEGNNINDWSQWEIENCQRLSVKAKSSYAFSGLPGKKIKNIAENPNNYISGIACDHYNRFQEDFDLAGKLNHNAHRFSIEWSRVEPMEGKFNMKEIEHYRKVISSLKERNIEPFVTLWHFTIPIWLQDKGGWKTVKVIDCFSRYVEKVVDSLKCEVVFWITINEPLIYATSAYLRGTFPAQEKNPISYFLVIKNLIKAHQSAFRIIKRINPKSRVGIAKSIIYFEAYKNKLFNRSFKRIIDWWWNYYFLNQITDFQDFIGLNHYFYNRINYGLNKNENKIISDMGWELYPEAIYYVLKDLKKYRKTIYITENGLADTEDNKRAGYIKEILKNVHKAIEEGVDVRGYFYWSLLDNFEWDKGFWPRFGLIEVDYQSLDRKVRQSALEYSKLIKDNRSGVN